MEAGNTYYEPHELLQGHNMPRFWSLKIEQSSSMGETKLSRTTNLSRKSSRESATKLKETNLRQKIIKMVKRKCNLTKAKHN